MVGRRTVRWAVVKIGIALFTATLLAQPAELLDHAKARIDRAPLVLAPTTIRLAAGDDIQAALDKAPNGAEIRLAPGLYAVNLRLRANKHDITIRSDVDDATLRPAAGGWIDGSAVAGKLAHLVPKEWADPIISVEQQAHDYTLVGLEIGGNAGHPDRTLVELGAAYEYTSVTQVPFNINLDQNYIHGDPVTGGHLGIMLGSKNSTITRNYVSGMIEEGRDSQAITGGTGPGPYTIEHNYLEGSGENVLFGGSDPSIPNLTPTDITFRYNYCVKPQAWRQKRGSVKNLFELKHAKQVLAEYNVFENVWGDGQDGSAILFTVRNQDGRCPWCSIADVTFRYNVIMRVEGFAFNVLGLDDSNPSVHATNLVVDHNLVLAANGVMLLAGGFYPTRIRHNTMLGIAGRFLSLSFVSPRGNLVMTDNVMAGGAYGITGDAWELGTPSLEHYSPGYVFTRNVIEGTTERRIQYPAGNYPIAFGALAGRLGELRRYMGTEGSTDGVRLGADVNKIKAALPWVQIP